MSDVHAALPHLHGSELAKEPSVVGQGGPLQRFSDLWQCRPELAVHLAVPHLQTPELASDPSVIAHGGSVEQRFCDL